MDGNFQWNDTTCAVVLLLSFNVHGGWYIIENIYAPLDPTKTNGTNRSNISYIENIAM